MAYVLPDSQFIHDLKSLVCVTLMVDQIVDEEHANLFNNFITEYVYTFAWLMARHSNVLDSIRKKLTNPTPPAPAYVEVGSYLPTMKISMLSSCSFAHGEICCCPWCVM